MKHILIAYLTFISYNLIGQINPPQFRNLNANCNISFFDSIMYFDSQDYIVEININRDINDSSNQKITKKIDLNFSFQQILEKYRGSYSNYVYPFHLITWSKYNDGLSFVQRISIVSQKEAWLGTINGLFNYYDGKWTKYTDDSGLSNNHVISLDIDKDGIVWVGTENGISKYNGQEWERYFVNKKVNYNRVDAIYIDSKNNKWFEMAYLGKRYIVVYNNKSWKKYKSVDGDGLNLRMIFLNVNKKSGSEISPIVSTHDPEDNKDKIRPSFKKITKSDFLTRNLKEQCFYSDTGIYNKIPDIKFSYTINSILDSKGNLWFKGINDRFYIYNGKNVEEFVLNDGIFSTTATFDLKTQLCFYSHNIDKKNIYWFSSINGLWAFDKSSWKRYSNRNPFIGNFIYDISIDSLDNIWFLTPNGIAIFNSIEFKIFEIPENIRKNDIICLKFDKYNNLWIGTQGNGVFCYNGKSWKSYTVESGLVNNSVNQIFIDLKGNVWFVTGEMSYDWSIGGVSMYDGKTMKNFCKPYNEKYPHNCCEYIIATTVDKNDNKYFCTYDRIYIYDNYTWSIMKNSITLNAITVDADNVLWGITGMKDLMRYDGEKWIKIIDPTLHPKFNF